MMRMWKCTQILYEIKLQYTMIHRHRGVLRFRVLFSSLILFRFRILAFHLKQKHEEGQRLSHYLRQTNAELVMCKCVCVRNKKICQN
jgi:hypothetical protein